MHLLHWSLQNVQLLEHMIFHHIFFIGQTQFEQICKPYLYDSYNLVSQMRCNGGNGYYEYSTSIDIDNGGNYGYTFRVLPKNEMLINNQDMSLVKWIES